MNLLKIGKRYINADRITEIFTCDESRVVVSFGNEYPDEPTVFSGDEAIVFCEWLCSQATVVFPSTAKQE